MLLNCNAGEDSGDPLDCKEIQPVHPKGDQSWIFFVRIDAEAETLVLWPPDAKNLLVGIDPDAGKDWRWEEKGRTKDEMVGWHHWLNDVTWVWINSGSWWWTGRPGVLQSMGWQRSDVTEQLNWTDTFQSSVMKSYSILPRRESYLCNHIQCILPSHSSCFLEFRSELLQYHSFVSSKPYFT